VSYARWSRAMGRALQSPRWYFRCDSFVLEKGSPRALESAPRDPHRWLEDGSVTGEPCFRRWTSWFIDERCMYLPDMVLKRRWGRVTLHIAIPFAKPVLSPPLESKSCSASLRRRRWRVCREGFVGHDMIGITQTGRNIFSLNGTNELLQKHDLSTIH